MKKQRMVDGRIANWMKYSPVNETENDISTIFPTTYCSIESDCFSPIDKEYNGMDPLSNSIFLPIIRRTA